MSAAHPAAHELRPGDPRRHADLPAAALAGLTSYLPGWLLARAGQDSAALQPGATARFSAVVLAGLLDRAAELDAGGEQAGTDSTAPDARLDVTLAALFDAAACYGGSVAGLWGERIVVLFPATPAGNGPAPSPVTSLQEAAWCAVSAARAMQMSLRRAGAGSPLRLGLAAGPVIGMVVGAGARRLALVAGRPVIAAADAAAVAAAGTIGFDGDLDSLLEADPGRLAADALLRDGAGEAEPRLFAAAEGALRARGAPAAHIAASTSPHLWSFLPPGYAARFATDPATGPQVPAAEYRVLAVASVRFRGLDFDADPDAPGRLQAYCAAVEAAIAPAGGTIAGLEAEGGGGAMHLLFGPVGAATDWSAAERTVRALVEPGRTPFGCPPTAGLAAGPVLAGPAGTAAQRVFVVGGAPAAHAGALAGTSAPGTLLVAPSGAPTRAVGPASPGFALPGSRLPLMDREPALALLRARSREAQAGRGGSVLIAGAPGLGKTRLLAALRSEWEAAGGLAAGGAGVPEGTRTPYALLRPLLRELWDLRPGEPPERAAEQLARRVVALAPEHEPGVAWLARLLGLTSPPGGTDGAGSSPLPARPEMIPALIEAQARARPLLLVCDDLDPADGASIQVVKSLAACAGDLPLLIAVGAAAPHPAMLEGTETVRVSLEGLERAAGLRLLAAAEPGLAAEQAAAISERSGGNPLFLIVAAGLTVASAGDAPAAGGASDAARSGRPLPANLDELLVAALGTLAPGPRQVLDAAAVLGAHAPLGLLRGLVPCTWGDGALDNALQILCRAGLLAPACDAPQVAYEFTHGLFRQVAYEHLPPLARRHLHTRAADTLERGACGPVPDYPDRLAYHRAHGDDRLRAAESLVAAGDEAVNLVAGVEAAAYYRAALDAVSAYKRAGGEHPIADDPWLALEADAWQKLARVQQRAGDYRGAEASLREALRLCPAAGPARAMLYCALSQAREARGDYAGALAVARLAAATLPDQPCGLAWARVRLQTGTVLWRHGRSPEALEAVAAALPILERIGVAADLAAGHKLLGNIYQMAGQSPRARAHYTRSLALYRQRGDHAGMAVVLNNLGNVAWGQGDLAGAGDHYRQGLVLMRASGNQGGVATALVNLASVALLMGDLTNALDLAAQSRALALRIGKLPTVALADNGTGEALELLGRPAAALVAHEAALDLAEEIGDGYAAGRATLGVARAALALGDRARCRGALEPAAPLLGAGPEIAATYHAVAGQLAAAEGRIFDARATLDQAAMLAADHGYKLLLAYVQRLRGELEWAQGRPALARPLLEQALVLATAAGARVERAHILRALAHAVPAPAAHEARSLLSAAHDIFVACGVARDATAVRHELEDTHKYGGT